MWRRVRTALRQALVDWVPDDANSPISQGLLKQARLCNYAIAGACICCGLHVPCPRSVLPGTVFVCALTAPHAHACRGTLPWCSQSGLVITPTSIALASMRRTLAQCFVVEITRCSPIGAPLRTAACTVCCMLYGKAGQTCRHSAWNSTSVSEQGKGLRAAAAMQAAPAGGLPRQGLLNRCVGRQRAQALVRT